MEEEEGGGGGACFWYNMGYRASVQVHTAQRHTAYSPCCLLPIALFCTHMYIHTYAAAMLCCGCCCCCCSRFASYFRSHIMLYLLHPANSCVPCKLLLLFCQSEYVLCCAYPPLFVYLPTPVIKSGGVATTMPAAGFEALFEVSALSVALTLSCIVGSRYGLRCLSGSNSSSSFSSSLSSSTSFPGVNVTGLSASLVSGFFCCFGEPRYHLHSSYYIESSISMICIS